MENEKIKKKSFSNKNQLERLVTLMEQNTLIAKGICKKNDAELKWNAFAVELNSLGPPIKTAEKWMKVWVDLKAKLKKKLINNKKEIHSTGGGPHNLQVLNLLEERISEFLNLKTCVDPRGRHFGINTEENIETENIETENMFDDKDLTENYAPFTVISYNTESPSCSNGNKSKKTKRANAADEKLKLLENHSEEFRKLKNDMSDIKEYMKTILEYTKKNYYAKKDKNKELINLKKEKLKVYKEEIEIKQRDRAMKLKLKIELIELQKQGFVDPKTLNY